MDQIVRYYDHQVYLKDPRDPSLKRDLPGFRFAPCFFAADDQAAVLGTLAGLDKPGLVRKSQLGWTSYYSSAPIISAAVVRQIVRNAGCHIYDDGGDIVVASTAFLSIYSPRGGDRTVRLPKPSTVTDLLTNKVIASDASEFPLQLAEHEAVIFQVENAHQPGRTPSANDSKVFRSYRASGDFALTADPNSELWDRIPGVVIDKSVLGPEVPHLAPRFGRAGPTSAFIFCSPAITICSP